MVSLTQCTIAFTYEVQQPPMQQQGPVTDPICIPSGLSKRSNRGVNPPAHHGCFTNPITFSSFFLLIVISFRKHGHTAGQQHLNGL